jgi:hypothetical protein
MKSDIELRLEYLKSLDLGDDFDIVFEEDGFPVLKAKFINMLTDEEKKKWNSMKWVQVYPNQSDQ